MIPQQGPSHGLDTSVPPISSKRKRVTSPEPSGPSSHLQEFATSIRRKHLRIEIPSSRSEGPTSNASGHISSTSPSSLFSAISDTCSVSCEMTLPHMPTTSYPITPARLSAPPISGLYFTPALRLPQDISNAVMGYCMRTYFQVPGVNQVMLFGRVLPSVSQAATGTSSPVITAGLPPILVSLLSTLSKLLLPVLPSQTHTLLFPPIATQARQAILNLYQPGEGISPHVDLLKRFGDGIIGVSLGSSCVMRFEKVAEEAEGSPPSTQDLNSGSQWDLYLPERSVLVLSEDARYRWTHGIGEYKKDFVSASETSTAAENGRWFPRGVRLSITFRWLLPGADVVGVENSTLKAEVASQEVSDASNRL